MIHRVLSTEDAAEFLRWLGQRRAVLCIDTETGGLEWWRQPVRLVQFGDARDAWVLSYRDWRGVIADALARYDRPVTFHNAPFDLHMLETHGLTLPPLHRTHDTFQMVSLAAPHPVRKLKPTAERLLGIPQTEKDELAEGFKKHGWDWATVPEDFEPYWRYAGQDTILTAQLAEHLWPLVQPYRAAYDLEMAVQAVAYRIERRGYYVDLDYTAMLRDAWEYDMAELRRLVPEFDVIDKTALQAVLLADGWEPSAYTKTGKVKFDKDVIAEIDSPFTRIRGDYKRLEKWKSAYLEHMLHEHEGGVYHPSLNTMGALTGRMSSPQQQYPRGPLVRNCILPDPGEKLWNADYDTMEMRVFAHFSQDPALLKAGREGLDFHRFTAATVADKDIDEVTAHERQTAKSSVSFGKLYGAGDEAVARQAGVTVAEVEAFNARYAELFPGVEQFMSDIVQVGRQRERAEGHPYIITSGGRRVPQLDGRTYALVNYLVQGSCADIFKRKMVELDAAGYGPHMILPVHDSVLFSLSPEMADEVPKIQEIMEERDEFLVPLTVGVSGPLARWGEESK